MALSAYQPQLRLPAELTDAIIHLLHDTKYALFSCSLVCKSWLPATRYHLFHTILIERISSFQCCRPQPSIAKNWSAELVELLQNEHCTIKPFVQTLCIDQKGSARRKAPSVERSLDQWMGDVLSSTSSSFTRLRSLRLEGVDLTRLPIPPLPIPETNPKLLGDFHTVTELTLTGIRFSNEDQAIALISGFPSLNKLTWLSGMSWKFGRIGEPSSQDLSLSSSSPAFPATFHLKQLTLSTDVMHSTLALALAERSADLSVTCEDRSVSLEQLTALNSLLQQAGPALRHLSYDAWNWTTCRDNFIHPYMSCSANNTIELSLSSNKNLSSIVFRQFSSSVMTHPAVDLQHTFLGITSDKLDSITFEMDFMPLLEYDDDVYAEDVEEAPIGDEEMRMSEDARKDPVQLCTEYDWTLVDSALRDAKFSQSLAHVLFTASFPCDDPLAAVEKMKMVEGAIEQKMKWCGEKGLLQFQRSD